MELKVGCKLPLGSTVFVSSVDEGVACTLLGLVSGVLHPTSRLGGEKLQEGDSRILIPRGLQLLMAPPLPVNSRGLIAPTILDELKLSGASAGLCEALAHALELSPSGTPGALTMGSLQLFALAKVLLFDPDVLCLHRPLSLVPEVMQAKVVTILQLWQSGGGLNRLATDLQVQHSTALPVYRRPQRTLIVSNMDASVWRSTGTVHSNRHVVHIDLDAHLEGASSAYGEAGDGAEGIHNENHGVLTCELDDSQTEVSC
jgi:hypothetical protein